MNDNFSRIVAYKALDLLDERKARLYNDRKAFYVWPLEDRLMLIFDPAVVDGGKLNEDFAHRLSTRMQGRLVVRTNSRGLFLQIGYEIPAAPVELSAAPLDLSRQPSPWHMPIGSTANGDLWLSLIEGDSFFVVGLRRMGKSAELHGFIQALLQGGKTLVYAWDGKDNAEYLRYVGRENFTLMPMDGLQKGLQAIQNECQTRTRRLAMSGHPNIISYNKQASAADFMPPIALVIDEVAEVEDQTLLLRQVKVNGAAGVYPIFATNDPTKSAVVAKSNLATRISFFVISSSDSVMGFGRSGANKLPKVQGRGLIVSDARVTEFQSFVVDYPKPTDEGLKWLASQLETDAEVQIIEPIDEIAEMAEKIRAQWSEGMSGSAVARLLGLSQYGGSYKPRIDKVVAYLTSTLYSTTQNGAEMPVLGAVEA